MRGTSPSRNLRTADAEELLLLGEINPQPMLRSSGQARAGRDERSGQNEIIPQSERALSVLVQLLSNAGDASMARVIDAAPGGRAPLGPASLGRLGERQRRGRSRQAVERPARRWRRTPRRSRAESPRRPPRVVPSIGPLGQGPDGSTSTRYGSAHDGLGRSPASADSSLPGRCTEQRNAPAGGARRRSVVARGDFMGHVAMLHSGDAVRASSFSNVETVEVSRPR